jgi:glyoxylase-like metal-dependent hydrolase (beta-lactamase superfamily II)
MEIQQIAPQLWWWTAPHPDWGPPDFEAGQGWERDVSCYALVEGDDLVLFDPLVPAGDEERFWAALDGDVEHHGPPKVLISVFWHARSSKEILDRYEGAELFAHEPSATEVAERVPVTQTFVDGDVLPGRVKAIAMHHMDEAAFWLPSHGALVFGDSVLGYEDRVQLCPESWLREGESYSRLRASANRAVGRRPRMVLLTHGGPRYSSVESL